MQVSIIVPTTRKKRVNKAVKTLLTQKTKYQYEIIIVGQKNVFSDWHRKVKKAQTKKLLNPSAARNFGAKIARGKYLLFLDDDCFAQPDWVEKNIKFLTRRRSKIEKIGAVGGKIEGYSKKYFALCADYTNLWRQQNNQPRKMSQLYTASLGVSREYFNKVGGFNENLWVGEDVDFVQKLARFGFQSYYEPSIVVLHHHRRDTLSKFLGYMYNNGLTSGLNIIRGYQMNWGMKVSLWLFERAYFLFVLPMALVYTLASFGLNFKSHPTIIFLLPFIFLGYFAYHIGIGVKCRKLKN